MAEWFSIFSGDRHADNRLILEGKQFLPTQFHAFQHCGEHFCVDLTTHAGLVHAYKVCAPLSTSINKLSFALSNARIWVIDDDEKDIPEYEWIKQLFIKPNPLQSGRELLMRLDQYTKLFGNGFLLKVDNLGIGNPIKSIWALNPMYMFPRYKGELYNANGIDDIIDHWAYSNPYTGQEIRFSPDQILHFSDIALNLTDNHLTLGSYEGLHNFHMGASRVSGLQDHIKNIVVAAKAIYGLNVDRGAQGILAPTAVDAAGVVPVLQKDKEDIQRQLIRWYGLHSGQGKVIQSPVPMSWTPMSYPVKDLMLYEGIQENIQRIADAFFLPYELLAHAKGTTFSNKEQAEKQMYQDAIIPVSMIYEQKLTDFLGIEKGRINFDFSHIEVLQQSEKEKEDAISTRTARTISLYNIGMASFEEVRMAAGLSTDFNPSNNNENED